METTSPHYTSKELGLAVPYIDASAIRHQDKVHLFIVNRHPDEEAEISIHIRGLTPSTAHHKYITGTSINDKNTFEEPYRVKVEEKSYPFSETIKLPPHSINMLVLS
uniref:Alpha-L-arabinofuranosidase C-terminal domain-containing protein n=1 Tax=Ignisphaera aggregans TaxID=334771 RepID=A0A7J2U276_9CREN